MEHRTITINNRVIIVSDEGRIYRIDSSVTPVAIVPLVMHEDKRGYQRVVIRKQYKRVHRLVAYAFGLIPTMDKIPGIDVDHINNNPRDNRLSNLQVISSRANRAKEHCHRLSQMNYEYAIYKVEDVEHCIGFAASLDSAAKFLGVDKSFVSQVVNGKKKKCKGHIIKRIPKRR